MINTLSHITHYKHIIMIRGVHIVKHTKIYSPCNSPQIITKSLMVIFWLQFPLLAEVFKKMCFLIFLFRVFIKGRQRFLLLHGIIFWKSLIKPLINNFLMRQISSGKFYIKKWSKECGYLLPRHDLKQTLFYESM